MTWLVWLDTTLRCAAYQGKCWRARKKLDGFLTFSGNAGYRMGMMELLSQVFPEKVETVYSTLNCWI